MRESVNLAGKRFGRWLVLDHFEISEKGEKKWLCRCDCGTEKLVFARSLKSGSSTSCGCLRKEKIKEALTLELEGKKFNVFSHQRTGSSQQTGVEVKGTFQTVFVQNADQALVLGHTVIIAEGYSFHFPLKHMRNPPYMFFIDYTTPIRKKQEKNREICRKRPTFLQSVLLSIFF